MLLSIILNPKDLKVNSHVCNAWNMNMNMTLTPIGVE